MTYTVGIAGITGKFSTLILQNLLDSSDAKIRGYCRNSAKLSDPVKSNARVEVIEGDVYDRSAVRKFVTGCDVVICGYLGDNKLMTEGQKVLVDACDAEGVPRYIASDYCFDYNKLEYGQHPAKDPMKIIQEYVKEKQNVKGVHVLIGMFMNTFWSPYFGVWDPKPESLTYWGSGNENWESTSYENAAKFVTAVALDTNAVGQQRYLGDSKTIVQIAEAFEQVYGRKPTLKQAGSVDELYKHMKEQYKKDPGDFGPWLPLCYQYYTMNGQAYLDEVQNKYNIPPETFKDYMQARTVDKL